MRLLYKGQRISALILSLDQFEAGSRWLRDLWGPSAMLVYAVLIMPCDGRCRHRRARCDARHRHVRHRRAHRTLLRNLCTSFHSLLSRHNRKLEDGRLVEGSNVVIRAGGDKGADSSWIPGLKVVEVHRSRQSAEQFERKEEFGFVRLMRVIEVWQ